VHLDVRNVVPIFLTRVLVCIVMRMWGKEVVSCHGDKFLLAHDIDSDDVSIQFVIISGRTLLCICIVFTCDDE